MTQPTVDPAQGVGQCDADLQPMPVADLIAGVAEQLIEMSGSLRGVEDAVSALSEAAPAQAARLRDLQDLDRAIQTAEALAAFLREVSAQGGDLGAIDCDDALRKVPLGAVAATLSGREPAPSGAVDPGFELL